MNLNTLRNFLEEVASPEGQKETLQALDITYRNAREIVSCYPEVALFLINVIDVVESFPLKRLREAREAIKSNSDTSQEYEHWESSISSSLNKAIKKMALSEEEKFVMLRNITSARGGLSLSEEEVNSLDLTSAILVASTSIGDTYYVFHNNILIVDEDGTGVMYGQPGHTT
jgi:hypothetical protein